MKQEEFIVDPAKQLEATKKAKRILWYGLCLSVLFGSVSAVLAYVASKLATEREQDLLNWWTIICAMAAIIVVGMFSARAMYVWEDPEREVDGRRYQAERQRLLDERKAKRQRIEAELEVYAAQGREFQAKRAERNRQIPKKLNEKLNRIRDGLDLPHRIVLAAAVPVILFCLMFVIPIPIPDIGRYSTDWEIYQASDFAILWLGWAITVAGIEWFLWSKSSNDPKEPPQSDAK
jgi:hypothetical protein